MSGNNCIHNTVQVRGTYFARAKKPDTAVEGGLVNCYNFTSDGTSYIWKNT